MNNKEVLQKAQSKKAIIGEMEQAKIHKSNWIVLICASIVAIFLMIIEGALGHYTAIYAIGTVCFSWASIFYFCQYFVAKRKHFGIFLGAVLETLGALTMITLYILFNLGVL